MDDEEFDDIAVFFDLSASSPVLKIRFRVCCVEFSPPAAGFEFGDLFAVVSSFSRLML